MADRTDKLPNFHREGELLELLLTVEGAQVLLPQGTLAMVKTATPTVVEKAADAAGVAFVTIILKPGTAGQGIWVAHPLSGREYGEFIYGPGGATDALIGTVVYVVDNQTVSNAGGGNSVKVGTISRAVSATKVMVRLLNP